jgi:hypothetical protein
VRSVMVRNLVTPTKPSEKNFAELTAALKENFFARTACNSGKVQVRQKGPKAR